MELKKTITDEDEDYFSIFNLVPEEISRISGFKSVADDLGESGIMLEPKQKIILNNELIHEVLIPYVEREIGMAPTGMRFYTGTIFDKRPYVNIRGEIKRFDFDGSYAEIFPIISFIIDDNVLLGQAYLSEHVSHYGHETKNLYFEIVKDGAILLAEQEARKIGGAIPHKLYYGGLGLYLTPVTWLKSGLDFIEKSFNNIGEEELNYLKIIKAEILNKRRFAEINDIPIIETLEFGYNRKLEQSLESILEFFRFPL